MEKVQVKSSKRGEKSWLIIGIPMPISQSTSVVIIFVLFLFVEQILNVNSSSAISSSRKHTVKKLKTPDFLYENYIEFSPTSRTKNTAASAGAAKFSGQKQKQSVGVIEMIIETGRLKHCSILVYIVMDPDSEMYDDIMKPSSISSLFRDMYILNDKDEFNKNKTSDARLTKIDLLANPKTKLKKLGANCIISLISLPTMNKEEKVLQKVHDKLTAFPLLSPRTERNKDYYIFLTNDPSQIEHILTSSHISFRFTYKLAIAISYSNSNVDSKSLNKEIEFVGKTLCFYCARGYPLIIDVDLTFSDSETDDSNPADRFFPNMLRNFNGGIIKASAISIGVSVQMQRGEPKQKVKNTSIMDSNSNSKQDQNQDLETEEWNWRPFKTGGTFLRSFISASESLNFTYKIRAGGGSGLKLKNGTYNGVIGDVLNGKVDIGVVTGITLSRLKILDFTTALDYLTLTFVHGSPDEIYSWKFIFWPFSPCLWTCIILTVIISIGFLFVLSFFERKNKTEKKKKNHFGSFALEKKKKKVWTLEKILLFILPTCLGQHFTKAEIFSFRCFAGNWHIFIIVISTAYLSTLYFFFIYPPLEHAPSTFDELPTSNYQLGMTYYGGAIYSWFKMAANSTAIHQIYQKMEKRKTLDCLRETLVHKYVCISYKTSILHAIRVEIGDKYGRSSLVIENAIGFEIPVALSLEKKSIHVESFSRITSSNFESGLTNFWRHKTYDELRAERLKKEEEQRKQDVNNGNIITPSLDHLDDGPIILKINHFRGAFTIFIFGSCLAFITFCTETSFSKIHVLNRLLDKILKSLQIKCYIINDGNKEQS